MTPEEERSELEKILHSEAFRSSPGLQKFLSHVVIKSIQGLAHEIKEYEIAVDVLGRPPNYDPRLDTTVRVQAHRLREKLKEYYAGEGVSDDILIELPKGHYIPQFSMRPRANGATSTSRRNGQSDGRLPAHASSGSWDLREETLSWGKRRARHLLTVFAALAAGALVFAAGVLFSPFIRDTSVPAFPTRRAAQGPTPPQSHLAAPLRALWGAFWQDSTRPIVAYSNSIFLVTETSDLLHLRGSEFDGLGASASSADALKLADNPALVHAAGPVFFDDDHTGTGEVMAVYYLTELFSKASVPLTVERSQLLETRDLRVHNVIFLGSTTENPLLAGLPLRQDFVFTSPQKSPTLWRNRVVNLRPRPGEKRFYGIHRGKQNQVLQTDYALVSFLPGVTPGRKIVSLGGLTTLGTQAAAQFVSSPSGAQALLNRLGHGSSFPQYFQCVLRVDVENGEVLRVTCVAARALR
jgi:hypothetical protein